MKIYIKSIKNKLNQKYIFSNINFIDIKFIIFKETKNIFGKFFLETLYSNAFKYYL